MRATIALIGGVLVALGGTVWILQGLGVIVSSSFMTNDRLWVVLGAVAVALGAALSWWGWQRHRRRPTEPPEPPEPGPSA
ncbi:MAG TPA: hypothetical protein VIA02_09380 [Candidatus Limnocylindria bacterium]